MPSDPVEVREMDSLTSLIGGLTIENKPDRWAWLGGADNTLTVRNVKDFLLGDKDFSDRYVFDWINWVPKKCNVFMWRATMDRIPTMVALRARNCFALDPVCVLCGEEEETVEHLFCKCETAARVWHFISKWCNTAPFFIFDIKDLLEFQDTSRKNKIEKDVLKSLIIISCWCIWKARNELKFENIKVSTMKIIQNIRLLGFLWFRSKTKHRGISWSNWCNFVLM
uniref:uncharacterized protein LOC122592132 n=1 Tax=Erigeron canadensis TaxID=72917 RepID=UPI001CB8DA6B|nr:uncharacterized protein LOC122592132 [Erigeron canadensis]